MVWILLNKMNCRCNVPVKANSCNKSRAHALTVLPTSWAITQLSYEHGAQHHLVAQVQILPSDWQNSCQGAAIKYHLPYSARLTGVSCYLWPHSHQWSACVCTGFKMLMCSLPLMLWLVWARKLGVWDSWSQVFILNTTGEATGCIPT